MEEKKRFLKGLVYNYHQHHRTDKETGNKIKYFSLSDIFFKGAQCFNYPRKEDNN